MNPIISTVFSADPAAHVWPNDDRLFIYGSHDEPGTNTHDTMVSYHVFSTTDLVNWTDHGVALHLQDVSWASSHMWAIDAVYRNGQYYLVYCAYEKGTNHFRTGLAVCSHPEGPFTDIGYIQGVEHGQDPALFVDTDDTPYLYWGYGGQGFACQLSDDLLSALPDTIVELTDQLQDFYEGPWLHSYKGKYYLSYPGLPNGQWPQAMYYAIADHPLGPYTSMGIYIPRFERQAGTNHGSITAYKNRWFAFHHSAWVSGISETRSLMCDELFYNDDGSIIPITPNIQGVALAAEPHAGRVCIELDAATVEQACGALLGTYRTTDHSDHTGTGYVSGFDYLHAGIIFFVQSGICAHYHLYIRYRAATGDQQNVLLVNHTKHEDPHYSGEDRYDKTIHYPQCTAWQEIDAGIIQLQTGDNTIRIYAGSGNIDIDRIRLVPHQPT